MSIQVEIDKTLSLSFSFINHWSDSIRSWFDEPINKGPIPFLLNIILDHKLLAEDWCHYPTICEHMVLEVIGNWYTEALLADIVGIIAVRHLRRNPVIFRGLDLVVWHESDTHWGVLLHDGFQSLVTLEIAIIQRGLNKLLKLLT